MSQAASSPRPDRDPARPVYVISVAASIVSVHPRTLGIYEEEGFISPARTPGNRRVPSRLQPRPPRSSVRRRAAGGLGVSGLGGRVGTRIPERLNSEPATGAGAA